MRKAYVLLLGVLILLAVTACPAVEPIVSFDASKAVPLEIELEVVNNTSDTVNCIINDVEVLCIHDFSYEDLICEFELDSNESCIEFVQLSNKKISDRCSSSLSAKPDYAMTTMKVMVRKAQDDELVYYGADPASFFQEGGNKNRECCFYIDPDKSCTDSFGHLISTTNEKVNGIEKGTVKARLSITDSGFVFSYITD